MNLHIGVSEGELFEMTHFPLLTMVPTVHWHIPSIQVDPPPHTMPSITHEPPATAKIHSEMEALVNVSSKNLEPT